ncbi:hypothetical protein Q3G72_031597 [Acer saccharum]|nr:hypothetical protein Q3G72_031597 [Acer saccharum]
MPVVANADMILNLRKLVLQGTEGFQVYQRVLFRFLIEVVFSLSFLPVPCPTMIWLDELGRVLRFPPPILLRVHANYRLWVGINFIRVPLEAASVYDVDYPINILGKSVESTGDVTYHRIVWLREELMCLLQGVHRWGIMRLRQAQL